MATKTVFRISGMTCAHCEKRVADAVKRLGGVEHVTASFAKKRAEVTFDAGKTSESEIKTAIEGAGYKVTGTGDSGRGQPVGKVIPVFLLVLAVYFIVKYTIGFDFINLIPQIDSTVSLVALFVTGLFTSVHCIAMCGGINLSQSVGASEQPGGWKRPLLYNLGRVISYTVIGGIVGGIGAVLFISQTLKGVIMLAAAVVMILMGLSMLGWLPWWLVPRLPKGLSARAGQAKKGKGPLVVGLLNGLLPCGPLQAMQLYALSTGSILTGALSMLLFSLGTVPLMLGAGLVFSMLKMKHTRGITRVSAVLVVLIAVVMLFNAANLFGLNTGEASVLGNTVSAQTEQAPAAGGTTAVSTSGYAVAKIEDGVQVVEADLKPSKYPAIMVQKGMPVKFNLKATKSVLNGCNGTVEFPEFNVESKLKAGDNIIEFTPTESGSISYTCWMGMIRGQIKVVDSLPGSEAVAPSASISAASSAPAAAAAVSADSDTQDGTVAASGSCCSVGGQQPVTADSVALAKIENGQQVMTVTVGDQGYSPAVLVVQKGVKTKIKLDPSKLTSCNGYIVFPELNGSLNLAENQLETPFITPESDFTFTCSMNMLHGYVKVVDDLQKVDVAAIVNEVSQYQPPQGAGSGCCG